MNSGDYERAAKRTATKETDLINCALGLCGESGEVADIFKKHYYQGHELNKDDVIEELGDVLWYVTILANRLGYTLENVMVKNIRKLKARYPDGFNPKKSINRKK